jgi:hypothetical protein
MSTSVRSRRATRDWIVTRILADLDLGDPPKPTLGCGQEPREQSSARVLSVELRHNGNAPTSRSACDFSAARNQEP